MSSFRTYPFNNSTILRIYDDKDIIKTDPPYQRPGNIWRLENKQLLIDSIINGYDIPKIYFHDLREWKTNNYPNHAYSIIDGRQRIEAIWAFMNNEIRLADDFEFNEDLKIKAERCLYSDLGEKFPKLKIRFDSFILPIICVAAEVEILEEMFSRLNEAVPLNAAEKRNAFRSHMVKIIRKISSDEFFVKKASFKDNRYRYMDLSAKFLYLEKYLLLENKIHDTKKVMLDDMVHKHKSASSETATIEKNVKTVLHEMNAVFLDNDPLLNSITAIPIYFLLFRQAYFDDKMKSITRLKLFNFVNNVRRNRILAEEDISKAKYDLLEYGNLANQGTNDASSIRARLQIISEYILDENN